MRGKISDPMGCEEPMGGWTTYRSEGGTRARTVDFFGQLRRVGIKQCCEEGLGELGGCEQQLCFGGQRQARQACSACRGPVDGGEEGRMQGRAQVRGPLLVAW